MGGKIYASLREREVKTTHYSIHHRAPEHLKIHSSIHQTAVPGQVSREVEGSTPVPRGSVTVFFPGWLWAWTWCLSPTRPQEHSCASLFGLPVLPHCSACAIFTSPHSRPLLGSHPLRPGQILPCPLMPPDIHPILWLEAAVRPLLQAPSPAALFSLPSPHPTRP